MLTKDAQKIRGKIRLEVLDEKGRPVKIWNENKLGKRIRLLFWKLAGNPIESGKVKEGLLNKLAAYGLRVPGLGHYGSALCQKNLIVSAGKAGMASRLNGDGSEAAFTYLALGTDNTAAAAGNTTLGAEIVDSGLARAAATASRTTTTVTNDTARLTKTFSVTGTKALVEIGAFNAASNGTMLGRSVFSVINVESGYTFIATYDFVIS
jgi:hypothetical protein